MNPMDTMVNLLTQVMPLNKIYPDIVPDPVQLPFIHYSETTEPSNTLDGNAGDTTTTVVSVCAATKSDARAYECAIRKALDQKEANGCAFYHQGSEYTLFSNEKVSSYDLTFKILQA